MKVKNIHIFLFILLLFFLVSCSNFEQGSSNRIVDSRSEFVLDTIVSIKLYEKLDEKDWNKLFSIVREVNNKMSRHIDDSEVSMINKSAGKTPIEVSESTLYVVNESLKFAKLTDGAFDPTIAPILNLWDIGGDNERVPSESEIETALELVNYRDVVVDVDKSTVFLKKTDMAIDLGAIAKGYACDLVVEELESIGIKNAILDFGGNIYVIGNKNTDKGYKIGIKNPYNLEGNSLYTLYASSEAIVSSGDYERYFDENGIRYHHIFDTRTGYPINNGVRATTVISNNSIIADTLSTILFVTKDEYVQKLNAEGYNFEYCIFYNDKIIEDNFVKKREFTKNIE